MGKTQGVKMEARPKPKATARKARSPSGCVEGADDDEAGGRRRLGVAGGNDDGGGAAAGSTVRVTLPVHLDGTHMLGLQVW